MPVVSPVRHWARPPVRPPRRSKRELHLPRIVRLIGY